jgi:hypothetical protein
MNSCQLSVVSEGQRRALAALFAIASDAEVTKLNLLP